MAKYSLEIKQSAQKELDALDDSIFRRIDRKLLALADNPCPPGCKKLRAYSDHWRIRIGDWRVVYFIDDATKVVTITGVAHRREICEFAAQAPIAGAVFGTPINTPAWRNKPSWFAIASEGRAISARLEEAEAQEMKAKSIAIPSSHVVMLSHPAEIAGLIERAAHESGTARCW